jgi:hypothetical protein
MTTGNSTALNSDVAVWRLAAAWVGRRPMGARPRKRQQPASRPANEIERRPSAHIFGSSKRRFDWHRLLPGQRVFAKPILGGCITNTRSTARRKLRSVATQTSEARRWLGFDAKKLDSGAMRRFGPAFKHMSAFASEASDPGVRVVGSDSRQNQCTSISCASQATIGCDQ